MTQFIFRISSQPDDATCGPTCLHAVYEHFGDSVTLDDVIAQTNTLDEGGTLAVFMGCHALSRGYRARIYTYNLQMFDPTWFQDPNISLEERLLAQMEAKENLRIQAATPAYLEFLRLGGEIRMQVLNVELIRRYLKKNVRILTGLSATFLYGESREVVPPVPVDGKTLIPDDVRGYPSGHFVVLCGYDASRRTVLVADPLDPNPIARDRQYAVDIDRAFSAIMLGIVTYDANLLVVRPLKSETSKSRTKSQKRENMDAHADRE